MHKNEVLTSSRLIDRKRERIRKMVTAATDSTAVNRPRWRRQKYLVNSAFQWKYTLTITISVFLIAMLMAIVMFGFLHEQARERVLFGGTAVASGNAPAIGLFSLGLSLVTLAALTGFGIVMTHRVSGPLFILERHLKEVAQGRFPTRRPLRKKDEFKDLHETFWSTVEALRAMRRAELAKLSKLTKTIASVMSGHPDSRERTLESVTAQIQAMREELAKALGKEIDHPSPDAMTSIVPLAPNTAVPAERGRRTSTARSHS